MFAKRLDQSDDAGILGRDAVSDGRGDADDFLEHFDKGVVFVFAGFDLAGFHAEGGFEVHSLGSVFGGWVSVRLCFGKLEMGRETGRKDGREWDMPVGYGGYMLREIRNPFCRLDGSHRMMH